MIEVYDDSGSGLPGYIAICPECMCEVPPKRADYHYSECGLPNVTLKNIIVYDCSCGSLMPEIHAISKVHLKIVGALLDADQALTREEARFIRKVLDLNGPVIGTVEKGGTVQ